MPSTHLVAVHPATDAHPRAFVAIYDPSSTVDTTRPVPMRCWIVGCGCGQDFPLEQTSADRIAALAAESGRNPAPQPRQSPDNGSRGGSGARRRSDAHSAFQPVSLAGVLDPARRGSHDTDGRMPPPGGAR